MRDEIQVKNHNGKNILILDFSKATKEIVQELIADMKDWIKTQPKNSLYTLTDISGLRFNKELVEHFKDFTTFNKPYVVAGVVIGLQGLQNIAYSAVMAFSDRKMPTFDTREEGMEWLVKQ